MKSLLLVALLVLGSIAHAETAKPTFDQLGFSSETEMQNYFKVVDVKVTTTAAKQVQLDAAAPAEVTLGNSFLDGLGAVLVAPQSPTGWIAFGKAAWAVVVANKPVINATTTRVTVLPQDKQAWATMAGWRGPFGGSIKFEEVNGFGASVITQKYTISYNYGGSLNGKGHYLANATIIPSSIYVAWGFSLDSSVEVGQILNSGTEADPNPMVDLQLKRSTKTIMTAHEAVDSFSIKGDGSMAHFSKSH